MHDIKILALGYVQLTDICKLHIQGSGQVTPETLSNAQCTSWLIGQG